MVESSPTVDQLLEQEQRLRFEKFGVESGLELGGILLATALERDLPIVLDVYCFGQTIFRAALPGSSVDNSEWIRRKKNTVLRFSHSSLYMGTLCRTKASSLEGKFQVGVQDYSSHGGSFPIALREHGALIGAVTVSGLPQLEDHLLVVKALERIMKRK